MSGIAAWSHFIDEPPDFIYGHPQALGFVVSSDGCKRKKSNNEPGLVRPAVNDRAVEVREASGRTFR